MINIFTSKFRRFSIFLILIIAAQLIVVPDTYAWFNALRPNTTSKGTTSSWEATGYSTCEGYAVLDDSIKYSGTSSLKLTNPSPYGSNVYFIAKTVAGGLKSGKTYRYGAMVKADNASSCTIYYNDIAQTSSLTPVSNSYDWVKFELSYTPTADGSLTIGFKCEDATAGLWIDDVFCYEYSDGKYVGKNLVSNGNFDGTIQADSISSSEKENVSEAVTKLQEQYDKIRAGDSFTAEEIKPVMGNFKYIPLYYREDINIDGNLEDWSGISQISMPANANQYQTYIDGANKDIIGKLKMAYDEKNLYLGMTVEDDNFVAFDNEKYWQGDSLQCAIGSKDDSYGVEIGFVRNPDSGEGGVYSPSLDDFDRKSIQIKTSQQENTTVYEIAIPWAVRYGDLPDGIMFDILINDNDGAGRAYGLELAPGIAEGKSNEKFPYIELIGSRNDWYSWIEGERNAVSGEDYEYDFYLVNEGDAKSFTLFTPAGEKEDVTVEKGMGIHRSYPINFADYGNQSVKAEINSEGKEKIVAIDVSVSPGEAQFKEMLEEIDGFAEEIGGLIAECENSGLTVDYEKIKYETILLFQDFMKQDLENGFTIWFGYNYDCLVQLHKEAKENLTAYLDGTKTPFLVPHYETSDAEADGLVLTAMTDTNGVKERRPVFFVGYGHFNYDSEVISSVGGNIMQVGDHLPATLKAGTNGEVYQIQKSGYQSVINLLQQAEETNVKIDYLFGLNRFPPAVFNAYPETKTGTKFNMLHSKVREAIKFCVDEMIPDLIQYQSLNSICIYNEPSFNATNFDECYQPYWAAYLAEMYKGDIALLNETYQSSYESFIDVERPEEVEATPRYWDYQNFNNIVFTDLVEYTAECIHKIKPDLPVHVKMRPLSAETDGAKRIFLDYGADIEKLAEVTEINGCDAHAYYNNSSWCLPEKLEMYDMLAGIKTAPIFNTEDHIIGDINQYFGYEQADHVEGDLWQGAIHGRAASIIWWWRRDYDPTNLSYGMWLNRPDCVEAVGRTQLDLNRLSYEVAAFANKKPDFAVLYSVTSRVYKPGMMNAMFNVYKSLLCNGQKVKFVGDTTTDEIFDYKTLFIPYSTHVPGEVVENVHQYVKKGGKVILTGKECLKYDEHNNLNDEEKVKYILNNSAVIDCETEGVAFSAEDSSKIKEAVFSAVSDSGLKDIELIDADTGLPVENVEYCAVDYDGRTLVNLCSYNTWGEDKKIKIFYKGREVVNSVDLRKNEKLGSVITAKPELPVLLAINEGDGEAAPIFDDIENHWAKTDILSLYELGIVKGTGNFKFMPENKITIAEFATMVEKALNIEPKTYSADFIDVSGERWFSGIIQAAYEAGMLDEIIDGNSVSPQRPITRQEMCSVLVKAYEYVNGAELAGGETDFKDRDSIGSNFISYVGKAYNNKIIFGMEDDRFAPLETATRAQAVTIIENMLKIK